MHDPKELRDAAMDIERHGMALRRTNISITDQLRAYADLIERHAKLRGHAGAMAQTLDDWARIDACKCAAVDAYRTDFQKE